MSDDVAVLDFDALLEMLGGKREVVASLLGTFLGELASDVDASREAMAEQDTVALRQIAHRIKGTSANLHAMMLSSVALELEAACDEADFALVALKHEIMVGQSQRLSEAIEIWRAHGGSGQ